MSEPRFPRRAPAFEGMTAYAVPRAPAPVDLDLSGNLGLQVPAGLLPDDPALVRAYPDAGPLEAALAARLGVYPSQVLVTAGADDAIDRACRAVLAPGRTAVVPVPGFEITLQRARLCGAAVRTVPWPGGPLPVSALVDAGPADLVVITSPNNPTGAVATGEDLRQLAAALPEALLLVDLAYAEYADEDLTTAALALPNAVVLRTLSKAWGLAGLRVGYAVGSARLVDWLRAAGLPYAASGPSLATARAWLERGEAAMRAHVAQVRGERAALERALAEAGGEVVPGQANFAFGRVRDALWLRDGMAGLGIGVRAFPGAAFLEGAVRIGCPGDPAALARTAHALATVLRPQALVLDLDGVLADVTGSYRRAIVETCAAWGVAVGFDDIAAIKAEGDANNDWVVCRRLLLRRGVDVPLERVTDTFEALVQGSPEAPGLWRLERLLVAPAWLEALAARIPLGIVTGRPRLDAERFLDTQGIARCFSAMVCMEDAPLKPDPAPVRLCLARLGLQRAWMVGDTPDDQRAARAAGVVPLAVVAPGEDPARATPFLHEAGAARVLPSLDALLELLP